MQEGILNERFGPPRVFFKSLGTVLRRQSSWYLELGVRNPHAYHLPGRCSCLSRPSQGSVVAEQSGFGGLGHFELSLSPLSVHKRAASLCLLDSPQGPCSCTSAQKRSLF